MSLHRTASFAGICAGAALLCQCETQRTVKSTRSSISFDEAKWGGQGNPDSEKIRSKFAEKGYSIGDDGTIQADRPDLYSGNKARETGSAFGKKEARFGKTEARTKEFRTPEYVKRQEFRGVEEARESGSSAREGNFSGMRDRASSRLFDRKSASSTSELATYETGADRESSREFSTRSDREGSEGIRGAPTADGIAQKAGYRANAALTVDDVKKMLSPGVYARATGADE